MTVKGLHLWNIHLTGVSSSLWVTTHKRDVAIATQKAETFKRRSSDYRGKAITRIEYHGTLDA